MQSYLHLCSCTSGRPVRDASDCQGASGEGCGRHLRGWSACGGIAATVDGWSWVWPLWSKKESNPDLATCKTRSGMEVT